MTIGLQILLTGLVAIAFGSLVSNVHSKPIPNDVGMLIGGSVIIGIILSAIGALMWIWIR